jgi:hypothetical protein
MIDLLRQELELDLLVDYIWVTDWALEKPVED